MPSPRLPLILALAAALAGCAVPPARPDAEAQSVAVDRAQVNAPAFRLHILEIGGVTIPPDAVEGSVRTLRRYIAGPVEVIRHAPMPTTDWAAGPFPVLEGGRPLTAADLPAVGPYLLRTPSAGLLGIAPFPGPAGEPADRQVIPLVEPGVALVAVTPGPVEGRGVTGRATIAARDPGLAPRVAVVVMYDSVIRARANWFVPRAKLYQWTLTHELGHVLRVPADRSHIRTVPGLGGGHCTHPECVMYTGLDWRVVVSGLLHGWPLDFCEVCGEELRRARAETVDGPASP